MSDIILIKIAVIVFLLLVSGFFSGSESSLFSLNRIERYRIRKEHASPSLRWVHNLVQDPKRLLSLIHIGNKVIIVIASVLTASIAENLIFSGPPTFSGSGISLMVLVATVFIYPLLLIFGETLPRIIALQNPDRFARVAAFPMRLFFQMVTPIHWVLDGLAGGIVRLFLGNSTSSETGITEQEFRTLVDISKEGGALEESEQQFIHNIFDFGDARISEVMTPRTDMFCLQVDQSQEEVFQAIEEHHHSRIPVYEKDKDDIIGILYSKDLFKDSLEAAKQNPWGLQSLLRKPIFIPQTKKANDLFREFRSHRIHMAIVVDEYGGVAGLVTMEDLLEDIFGEILDEYDPDEAQVKTIDETTIIIPARMSIEAFNQRLGTELPEDEYETMGGLVFDLFGKLPSPGSRVSYMRYTFTIEKMLGTRILELRVKKEPEQQVQEKAETVRLPDDTDKE